LATENEIVVTRGNRCKGINSVQDEDNLTLLY